MTETKTETRTETETEMVRPSASLSGDTITICGNAVINSAAERRRLMSHTTDDTVTRADTVGDADTD